MEQQGQDLMTKLGNIKEKTLKKVAKVASDYLGVRSFQSGKHVVLSKIKKELKRSKKEKKVEQREQQREQQQINNPQPQSNASTSRLPISYPPHLLSHGPLSKQQIIEKEREETRQNDLNNKNKKKSKASKKSNK